MTSAASLQVPIVFDRLSSPGKRPGQEHQPNPTRSWKRTYPDRLGYIHSDHSTSHSTAHAHADRSEYLLDLWGCIPEAPSHPSGSSSTSTLIQPNQPVSSLVTWDDSEINGLVASKRNSQHASALGEEEQGSAPPRPLQLEAETASLTYAPFCPRLHRTRTSSSNSDPLFIAKAAFLGPVRGRMIAVGLQEGSTLIFQSREPSVEFATTRAAAYPESTASPVSGPSSPPSRSSLTQPQHDNASFRLSVLDLDTMSASARGAPSTGASSSLRSPSRIAFSREPSPGFQQLGHGASFSSTGALSTLSLASTHTSATAGLQIEEAGPARMVETNVTAVGQSIRSPTNDAEHALEVQKLAAERSEHAHGMVGGVIEALGFGGHSRSDTSTSASAAGVNASSGPSGRTSRGPSSAGLSSPISPSSASLAKNDARLAALGESKAATKADSDLYDASRRPSATGSTRRSISGSDQDTCQLRPLLRLADTDRSPVVALRVYTTSGVLALPSSSKRLSPALLVVHAEGLVSSWSLTDGSQLWQLHLDQAKVESTETAADQTASGSSRLDVYDALTPIFSQLSSSMSRSASASVAGDKGTGKGTARNQAGDPRLRDGTAVRLASDVRVHSVQGQSIALIRDQQSSKLHCLDLESGCVVAKEDLEDCLSTCSPAIRLVSEQECEVTWIQCSGHVKSKNLIFTLDQAASGKITVLSFEAASAEGAGTDAKEDTQQDQPALNNVGHFDQIIFADEGYVFGFAGALVQVWKLEGEKARSLAGTGVEGVSGLISFDSSRLIAVLQTTDGAVTWNLNETEAVPKRHKFRMEAHAGLALPIREPGENGSGGSDDLLVCNSDLQLIRWNTESGSFESLRAPTRSLQSGAVWVTATLPISLERVAVSLSSGHLVVMSLSELAQTTELKPQQSNSIGPGKDVCILRQALSPRSGKKVIVGGTRQGQVAFWDASTLELIATWSLSSAPIEAILTFGDQDNALRLHGCIACIAADSSVSIVLLDGLKLLHSIPGRDAKLLHLGVRADELLLTYDDGKARVWDMRGQELRRSIATDQAQALIEDGKGWWSVRDVDPFNTRDSGTTGMLSAPGCARGATAATLLADFRRSIEVATRAVNPASASRFGTVKDDMLSDSTKGQTAADVPEEREDKGLDMAAPGSRKALGIIRPLLLLVLPLGLDEQVDRRAAEVLGMSAAEATSPSLSNGVVTGAGSFDSLLQPLGEHVARCWTTSQTISTPRALICAAMLRILCGINELSQAAEELLTVVREQLPALVGEGFKDFSLPWLTLYTLDSNVELQEAAKMLFSASLARRSEAEIEELCSDWQSLLPFNQPPVMGAEGPMALALLGGVAVERYKSMSPRLLKEIAVSISMLIADEGRPMHQAIAIELCRTGFSIWQHYFDATEMVRSLFTLATSRESGAVAENRWLARQATLQVASDNTPLFMTTLSLDILHARSAAHCSATMRLVAFMVRKRPLVLYANLPRLAEAVVKSLDPTVTAMREAVVEAATVMIGELVNTYPTIAFHGKQQRLAVGTHEGAVIMYDLKTATRLYVIEGHRRQLSACGFSPDGRRLVTVSVDEGKLLIWKVGTTFTSMFTPGQLPRQGGTGDSGAYKSIDFNVGTAAGQAGDELRVVSLEWANERSVRVKLGEAQMSLSVD